MAIGLLCRHCGTHIKAPESAAGKLCKCPKCKEEIRVIETASMKAHFCDHCGKPLAKETDIHEVPGKVYCDECFVKIESREDTTDDLTLDQLGLEAPVAEEEPEAAAGPKPGKGQRASDAFLLDLLVQEGVMESGDAEVVLRYQEALGKRLIPVLEDLTTSQEEIARTVSEATGLETCPPGEIEVAEDMQDVLSGEIMSRYDVIPLRRDGDALELAFPNPLDISSIKRLRDTLGAPIIPRVCTWSQYTQVRLFLKAMSKGQAPAQEKG